ncbi:MAG: helix-turn-helix domain-containing protein, partial [Parachlamydiaceae bacterium]
MTEEENLKLGDIFKRRRKELNISLKEVESATSIRMNYLSAIEEGDYAKLISPIYAQGFVKQYAGFLGLDGEDLVRNHQHLFSQSGAHDFAYGIGTLEMRGNPGTRVKGIPTIVWISAF